MAAVGVKGLFIYLFIIKLVHIVHIITVFASFVAITTVRLSVTRWYCVKTAELIVEILSASSL